MSFTLYLQLVSLSALWGASFIFIRMASPDLGPGVLAASRIALATLTLAVLVRALRHTWAWAHWRTLAVIGFLSVTLPFLLFAWAALHLPAGYSALLNSTAVMFGIGASVWLGEDQLTSRKVLGCVLGSLGVGFIVGLGPVQTTPVVLLAALACVGAAACYGFSAPLMKRALQHMQPLQIAAGIHLTALLMLLPPAAWGWPQARFTATAAVAVVVMGVVTSGLAYWLHVRILSRVTPVAAMSSTFLIPVFGVLWGHLFLGEALGAGVFIGGALVLVASALVTGFNPWQRTLEEVDAQP